MRAADFAGAASRIAARNAIGTGSKQASMGRQRTIDGHLMDVGYSSRRELDREERPDAAGARQL
jgi:hypothetical protein